MKSRSRMRNLFKKLLITLRHSQRQLKSLLLVVLIAVVGFATGFMIWQRGLMRLSGPDRITETAAMTETANEPEFHEYTVQRGESLWSIAEKFYGDGLKSRKIAQANNLNPEAYLEIGQVLKIPRSITQPQVSSTEQSPTPLAQMTTQSTDSSVYVVQPGDSLWKISVKQYGNGFKWPEIYTLNRSTIGRNPNLIYPQTRLNLPKN